MSLSASDLFALSQGCVNHGDQQCHWCGSACDRTWTHDDVPSVPFMRSTTTARCPGNAWVCAGCWLWRRGSVTVNFLGGGQKDRQKAGNHSWLVTEEGAWALGTDSRQAAYDILLKPPRRFLLALRTDVPVLLQLALANDHIGLDTQTPIKFTLNNIPHTYTVYELAETLRHGPEGREPGARALLRYLGPVRLPEPPPEVARVGRPNKPVQDGRSTKKVIVASGRQD